jgi:hypothetical protein
MYAAAVEEFRAESLQLNISQPRLRDGGPPRLLLVVDTEEEFDWSAAFSRSARGVSAIKSLHVLQRLCERFHLEPTYVLDFPVASQRAGIEPIREMLADGRCAIGAHLHPWVNPPYDEPLTNLNSFACNLEPPLESAKLEVLHAEIASAFGRPPAIYKAGRYGIGVNTLPALRRLGFQVDTSVNPHMDFSPIGGPDFSGFPEDPFLIGGWLAEVPCTTGFDGSAWRAGERLYHLATGTIMRRFRAPGVLARLGILNRINLSPETSTLPEMLRLTRALVGRGVRTLTISFHSPSMEAGHTPYVRTSRDLREFLGRVEGYFDFFFGDLEGQPTTPFSVRAELFAGLEEAQ